MAASPRTKNNGIGENARMALTASVASLARWRAITGNSPLAWPEVLEHTISKGAPTALHTCNMFLAMSSLYSCKAPDSPSKSRITWMPVTRIPLARTRRTASFKPPGWPATGLIFMHRWCPNGA